MFLPTSAAGFCRGNGKRELTPPNSNGWALQRSPTPKLAAQKRLTLYFGHPLSPSSHARVLLRSDHALSLHPRTFLSAAPRESITRSHRAARFRLSISRLE